MKNIILESLRSLSEGSENKNYMFFQNLKTIRDAGSFDQTLDLRM